MFKILQDEYVGLMLDLSSERRKDSVKGRLKNINMKKLYDLCEEHELHGVVASHIQNEKLCTLPSYWMEAYQKEEDRLSFLKNKAKEICGLMLENGIPMVILKNGGIMADIVDDAAACPMEDIDSLVRKEDFYQAHEILVKNGFVFKFRSVYEKEELEQAYLDGSTEYYIPMPNGGDMWFELSWRAIAGRWIRPDKELDTKELFSRIHYAKNTAVGILSPEDNLLQVCIHTAKHSYVRSPGLRLHLDVERIVSHENIDWELFVQRTIETHVCTSTYYSLLIPKILFGTPIPEWVLERIRPKKQKQRKLEKIFAKVGLLHPTKKKFSKLSFLNFQTSLYDSKKDQWRVIYPSWDWYKEKYKAKSKIILPWYILLRCLDLVGIRKKK